MPFEASNGKPLKVPPSKRQLRAYCYSALVEMFLEDRYLVPDSPYHLSALWINEFLGSYSRFDQNKHQDTKYIRPIVFAIGSAGERVSQRVYENLTRSFGINTKLIAMSIGVVCGNDPICVLEIERDKRVGEVADSDLLFSLTSPSNYVTEKDLRLGRIVDKNSTIDELHLLPSECIVKLDNKLAPHSDKASLNVHSPLGKVGLVNPLNASFINSSLQAMLHIPQLASLFTNEDLITPMVLSSGAAGSKGKVACAIMRLFHEYYSTSNSVIDTTFLVSAISQVNDHALQRMVQDPYVFSVFILDCLQKCLNNVDLHCEAGISNGIAENSIYKGAFDRLPNPRNGSIDSKNDSCTPNMFTGVMKQSIECTICHSITESFEPYHDLSLRIPGERSILRDVVVVLNQIDLVPLRTRVSILRYGTIGDIKNQLLEIIPELRNDNTNLIACEVFNGSIVKIFDDDAVVVNVVEDSDDLVIYQITTPVNKEVTLPCSILDINGVGFGLPFFITVDSDLLSNELSAYTVSIKRCVESKLYQQTHNPPPIESLSIHSSDYQALERADELEHPDTIVFKWGRFSSSKKHKTKGPMKSIENGGSDASNNLEKKLGCLIIEISDHSESELKLAMKVLNKQTISHKEQEIVHTRVAATPYLSPASSSPPESFGDPISVESCLEELMKPRLVNKVDSKHFCEKCKTLSSYTKSFEFWSTPDVLMVHLQRFPAKHDMSRKIDDFVKFPTCGLNINSYVSSVSPEYSSHIYDLVAVNNSENSGFGGNYFTCTTKDTINREQWVQFRDSFFSPVEDAVTNGAYILYYMKRNETSGCRPDGCSIRVDNTAKAVAQLQRQS